MSVTRFFFGTSGRARIPLDEYYSVDMDAPVRGMLWIRGHYAVVKYSKNDKEGHDWLLQQEFASIVERLQRLDRYEEHQSINHSSTPNVRLQCGPFEVVVEKLIYSYGWKVFAGESSEGQRAVDDDLIIEPTEHESRDEARRKRKREQDRLRRLAKKQVRDAETGTKNAE